MSLKLTEIEGEIYMRHLLALLFVGICSFSAHAQETGTLTDTELLLGPLPKPGILATIHRVRAYSP